MTDTNKDPITYEESRRANIALDDLLTELAECTLDEIDYDDMTVDQKAAVRKALRFAYFQGVDHTVAQLRPGFTPFRLCSQVETLKTRK